MLHLNRTASSMAFHVDLFDFFHLLFWNAFLKIDCTNWAQLSTIVIDWNNDFLVFFFCILSQGIVFRLCSRHNYKEDNKIEPMCWCKHLTLSQRQSFSSECECVNRRELGWTKSRAKSTPYCRRRRDRAEKARSRLSVGDWHRSEFP